MNVAEAEYLSGTRDRLVLLAKSERYSDEARATLWDVAWRLDLMLASESIEAPAADHAAWRPQPHQRSLLDAASDPSVVNVVLRGAQ